MLVRSFGDLCISLQIFINLLALSFHKIRLLFSLSTLVMQKRRGETTEKKKLGENGTVEKRTELEGGENRTEQGRNRGREKGRRKELGRGRKRSRVS